MREGRWPSAHAGARTFSVVLPAALPGIITGVILALARIAGETAPLLFTAFNNRFWNTNPLQPTASLTVQILRYAELAVRGLAPAGMGWRARAGQHRAHLLDPRPHGDPPARRMYTGS